MKIHVLLSVLILLAVIPGITHAAQFRSGDHIRITDKTPIAENMYVGGGEVSIETPIQGDLFVGGGNVRITGQVQGDLFIGGGDVRVEGPVNGDLRVGGGNVTVSSDVAGEVLLGGGDVEITSDATVGNMWVGAGQLRIAGTTGAIEAGTGHLVLLDTAHVRGNLKYMSEKEADIAQDATVDGTISHSTPPAREERHEAKGLLVGGGLLWYLSYLLMLLLFLYVFPVKTTELVQSWKHNFPLNLLWGIIFLILVPIVAILLLISVIGLPLGIGSLLAYPIILYVGDMVATLAIGAWIRSFWIKETDLHADWIAALIGFVVVTILTFIPVLGALILFVAFLAGLGALVKYDWEFYQVFRHKDTI